MILVVCSSLPNFAAEFARLGLQVDAAMHSWMGFAVDFPAIPKIPDPPMLPQPWPSARDEQRRKLRVARATRPIQAQRRYDGHCGSRRDRKARERQRYIARCMR